MLGHGHGAWVMAQLSHIGRVGPLGGKVGPCNDNFFIQNYSDSDVHN